MFWIFEGVLAAWSENDDVISGEPLSPLFDFSLPLFSPWVAATNHHGLFFYFWQNADPKEGFTCPTRQDDIAILSFSSLGVNLNHRVQCFSLIFPQFSERFQVDGDIMAIVRQFFSFVNRRIIRGIEACKFPSCPYRHILIKEFRTNIIVPIPGNPKNMIVDVIPFLMMKLTEIFLD